MVFSPSRTQTRGLVIAQLVQAHVRKMEFYHLLKVFLVWLVIAIRIANLLHDVVGFAH